MQTAEHQAPLQRHPLSAGLRSLAAAVEEYVLDHRADAVLTLKVSGARIVVIAAKRPGRPWDPIAREHIEQARGSYRQAWGNVPCWDHFDTLEATSQYIAYVLYSTADGRPEYEALTGRLVRDEPDDVTFYATDAGSLCRVLAASLQGPVAGDSRIGSIRPRHSKCNAYTLEAFAAVRLAMMAEARLDGVPYIACQLRPDLDTRVLSKNGIHFGFPRTEELLGLGTDAVRLDRHSPRVLEHLFEYPGYFLDSVSVHRMLQQAIRCGWVRLESILERVGLLTLDELCRPRNLHLLAPLITALDGFGAYMRERITLDVDDGVYSSVVTTNAYQDRAWNVLRQLGATAW